MQFALLFRLESPWISSEGNDCYSSSCLESDHGYNWMIFKPEWVGVRRKYHGYNKYKWVLCFVFFWISFVPLKIFSGGVDGGRQDVGLPGPQNTPSFFPLYLKAPSFHAEDIVFFKRKKEKTFHYVIHILIDWLVKKNIALLLVGETCFQGPPPIWGLEALAPRTVGPKIRPQT